MPSSFQCPRCRNWVHDTLRSVHNIQCRVSVAAPNFAHQTYSSHQPYPHTTLHHPPLPLQPVIPPAQGYMQAASIAHPIVSGSRNHRSDSESWRRELEELHRDLLRKIDTSHELRSGDRQICSEYVNSVKVYRNLVVYAYAHLMSCTTNRWFLDELRRKITKWTSWYNDGGDLKILRKSPIIKDELIKILGQSQTLCPVHVSVQVTGRHIIPDDDTVALRCFLVLCGRDHEDEFYSLAGEEAQVVVDMLEEVLRDPSIDDATHARLLRYTIRLSRKSGCLPSQLLLNIEPHQMTPIGHGGSATIYQASYQHSLVAVKKSNLPHLAQCHKEFVSEAVIWSHLRHENIVPFIGVVEKGRSLWLVSQFMYGGNVKTHLQNMGRHNCDLRHLAEGAAKGLRHLHTLDPPIVHGDLKGCNVLIDARGNACLVDFGISHSYDSRQILDSSKVGRQESLNWIAPEIMRDPENFRMTLETDMYAFACVLYEIYTGNIPFHNMNVMQSLQQQRRPSLEGLDVSIKRLIEACWRQYPMQRMKATSVVETLQNMRRL